MNILFQIILMIASVLTAAYMLRKIRKSQLKIEDSLFWIVFAIALFILSVFPQIAILCSKLLGIQSASNFIFLAIIFVLLLNQFLMTVKLSHLQNKLQTLIQRTAINNHQTQALHKSEAKDNILIES